MESDNIKSISAEQNEQTASSFNISSFFWYCLRRWPWFLASVILCMSAASLYILCNRPVFTRNATVLFKETSSRKMSTSDIESLLSFSGGSVSTKVANEVIVFQSPFLMQEVIKRLGLTTDYYSPSFFRKNVLYGTDAPISVDFAGLFSDLPVDLCVEPSSDGKSFILTDISYTIGDEVFDVEDIDGVFGDTLSVDEGKIVVLKNKYCFDKWEDVVLVKHVSLTSATYRYCSGLSVSSVDVKNKSDILNLEIKDNSVQRADDVINMLINVYNESWVEDKNKMAVSTSDFIDVRLSSLERELGDVDNDISNFKSENLLPDLSAVSDMFMEQSKETSKQSQDMTNQLAVFRYVKSYLDNNPGIESLVPMISSMGNNNVINQIAEYNKAVLTRNNLLSNSSDKNPLVQDLEQSLHAMRLAIVQAIDNQIGTISTQLDNLRKAEISNNNRIARNPSQAKYLLTVGRQQKVKETLYLYLLQKREENELSRAFSAYNTRVVTPPMGPAIPTSPKKMRVLLIALILSLLSPTTVFYVKVISDTKVRKSDDIKNLSLPYLGEVPLYQPGEYGLRTLLGRKKPESQLQQTSIVVRPGERNIINESFRVIRTNLEFVLKAQKNQVIVTCSFNPGSGKTFIAMNVSAVLALNGKKVIAIDGDLRRGSLSEFVESPRKGICNYLNGENADVHQYIVPVPEHTGLDVLPIGKVPPNPTELVSQPLFAEMIQALKSEYDYIVIDCPPVDIVADTQIISSYADRTLFVARAGLFDLKDVPALQKLYDTKRLKGLCYILNGVDTIASYYGHYGHYGHYGYYYGSK